MYVRIQSRTSAHGEQFAWIELTLRFFGTVANGSPGQTSQPRYSTLPQTEMLWPLMMAPSSEHR